jgi:hypothetical protein
MIKTLPCGCEATYIKEQSKMKEVILSGTTLFFNNYRTDQSLNINGTMTLDEGKVSSTVWVSESGQTSERLGAEFDLAGSIKKLDEFFSQGYDFYY